jgi:23S rRNA U2552 (ribose-2'-O)-methylase RlmE/FtsJ
MVVGMDIQKIVPLGGAGNVRVFQGDVFDKETVAKAAVEAMADLEKRSGEAVEPSETVSPSPVSEGSNPKPVFDLMTSDIAPSTTGMTGVDQYRSIELNLAILEIADTFLKKGGNLVLKVFVGEDVDELVGPTKARFTKLVRIKPKACRDRSFEEYFVCFGKK